MTEHILVEDTYVKSLIEQAAWDVANVSLVEKKDSGQKKGDEPKGKAKKDKDKPDFETGARKGDKGAGKDKDDKPDYTTDQRKGDKSKTHKGKDYEKCPTGEDEVDDDSSK